MTDVSSNGNGDRDYAICGKARKNGEPCTKPAGWGTGHPGFGPCKLHLGNTPNHTKKAAVQEAIVMGAPLDIEPHDALLHCVSVAAGEVHYCSMQVAKLELEAATPERVETKAGIEKGELTELTMTSNDAQLNIWIRARHEALDRLARYAKMALDAGVAERQVRLAEQLAATIAPAIQMILEGLQLSKAQEKRAPQLVRAAIVSLEGSGRQLEASTK